MTINVDAPNTTIELIFTTPEWDVVSKVQQQSPGELRNLLQNWVKGQEITIREELKSTLTGKLARATDAQLAAAKIALGL